MNAQRIIVLEDDPHQIETLAKSLHDAFPECRLDLVATEWEFRELISKLTAHEVACVIVDAMVPWSFPSEDMPFPPQEVQQGGVYLAGRRCADFVLEKFGDNVPICVRTVLSREDAGIIETKRRVFHEKSPSNGDLIRLLRELMSKGHV